jgi:hypothetical protein
MKKTISLVLVLALGLVTEAVNADFTFDTPTNLGSTVNSSSGEGVARISADGLSLYFASTRPGGYGGFDIWLTTRTATGDPWGEPVNLGPIVNSSSHDYAPSISVGGLSLYFTSDRSGGYGGDDIWMATRETTEDDWGTPVNLGASVNSGANERGPSISADALELYFHSSRPGGSGGRDIWVATRTTTGDPWDESVNLGPIVNGSSEDLGPSISADGLLLFFASNRSGGHGSADLWVTTLDTIDDDWGTPVNPGPPVNSSAEEFAPSISPDGRTLYFTSDRAGGSGQRDLWQASISPVVDFNGDGIVNSADMCIMVDHWGEDYPLCDIGPMPWGDGIVDVQDLIVLAEHLFEDYRMLAHWKLDETEGDIAYDGAGDNDGTVYGTPAWQPADGKVRGALQFDGIDDYVSTAFILDAGAGAFSTFAWIKTDTPGQVIISQADQTVGRGLRAGSTWLGTDPSGGKLMTGLMETLFGPLESDSVITDGQWHHVGLVYDLTGFHRHLYVDGAQVAEDANPVGGVASSGGLYIGAGQDLDAASFFSGLIDDVRIYNTALSGEEIGALVQ